MYNDKVLRIPADEADLWEILQEHFNLARYVLEMPLETKEQAFDVDFQSRPAAELDRISMGLIRYRNVSEENDQREYYLDIGLKLIPFIEKALEVRRLTPEFVQQWGKLMFCHGYVASHVFDDSDDLETYRNRVKGTRATDRTPQRIFLARFLLWFMDEQKQRRKQAEPNAAKAIWDFIEKGNAENIPGGYDLAWFKTLVRDDDRGRIVSPMEQNNMSEATLRELAAIEFDGLPPIELLVPPAQP